MCRTAPCLVATRLLQIGGMDELAWLANREVEDNPLQTLPGWRISTIGALQVQYRSRASLGASPTKSVFEQATQVSKIILTEMVIGFCDSMNTGTFGPQLFLGDRIEHYRSTLDGAFLQPAPILTNRRGLCHMFDCHY